MTKRTLWIASVGLLALLAGTGAAQEKRAEDLARRLLARTEAQHVASRRNLDKILRADPRFWREVQAVAARLGTHPAWLLNVIASESLFVPSARNRLPRQSASGLLQMIEATADRLGTTTEAIRHMTPREQLPLIEAYFQPFRGRLGSLADVYTAVLRGTTIRGGEEAAVAPLNDSPREQRKYRLNRWLDLNADGRITKGELGLSALGIGRFTTVPQQASSTNVEKKEMPSPDRRRMSIYGKPRSARQATPPPAPTHSIYSLRED